MEGVVVEDDRHFLAVAGFADFDAFLAEHGNRRFDSRFVVDQFRLVQLGRIRRSDFGRYFGMGSAGPFLLFLHGFLEAVFIDFEALFAGDFFGQFHGEAIRIVEFEDFSASEDFVVAHMGHHIVEQFHALCQGSAELFFFCIDNLFDEGFVFPRFRIFIAEDVQYRINETGQEEILDPQKTAEADGTAQDTAQDITTAFIGRQDAIGNHKSNSADMVGNDLHGHLLARIIVIAAGNSDNFFDDWEDEVRFKVRFFLLDDRSQSFQTAARIDVLLGQRFVLAVFSAVVLGEDEVPDFQVAVAVAADGTRRFAAASFRAEVIEDFTVRTARAFADFPEVIVEFENPFVSQANHIMPVVIGFFVIGIDGDIQFIRIQFQDFGQEFPGPGNGFFLEVVAKGEIAQHFKERMVTGRTAYVVDIVSADALLTRRDAVRRRYELTREIWFERCHAGADEEQAGVVFRNERKTVQDQVLLALKEL